MCVSVGGWMGWGMSERVGVGGYLHMCACEWVCSGVYCTG